MDKQTIKSHLKEFIFEFSADFTHDSSKINSILPNSSSTSNISLVNSVIHSTIETIQKINDSVEQRYPTPRNSSSENNNANTNNNQEESTSKNDNRKHILLFNSIWKNLKATTVKSDNFVTISKKFENLKIYTKDFDECFTKSMQALLQDKSETITSWEQFHGILSLVSVLMLVCCKNITDDEPSQASITSITSVISYLSSSCENFLVKHGILGFLEKNCACNLDSQRTESESSSISNAVYIDKNHETTRFVLSSMTTSSATSESWCNVDDLAKRNSTATPTSVSSALASDNEIIPEVEEEEEEDETFNTENCYLRSNISVATIKPNTTSDTLVDKKFTLSRDKMSDIEDDHNIRPLSNVLQPSRTELPKSSAHLLSAVSHEDMKKMIAAASSNCLIDKMGDLPEENNSNNFNKSFDEEDEDVGVKLRVSQISNNSLDEKEEQITNTVLLPDLEEAENEKYSVGNSGDNSRRLSEEKIIPTKTSTNHDDSSVLHESINNSINSSLLTDITPTTPPLASYNSVYQKENEKNVDVLENEENLPPTNLLPTRTKIKKQQPKKVHDKSKTDGGHASQLDLPTAAVLGGAIAGLSAYLYLKLK